MFRPCLVVHIRGLILNQHPRSTAHAVSFSVPINQCNTGLFRLTVCSIDESTHQVAPLEWMLIIHPLFFSDSINAVLKNAVWISRELLQ